MNNLLLIASATSSDEAAANGALALLVIAYFFPTIVASLRRHPYEGSIFIINLFLGWTFLGWVISMAWSVFPLQRPARAPRTVATRAATIVEERSHVSAIDKLAPASRWELIDRGY